MNLFNIKNVKTFGPAILVSFLGFFIGYFEKTTHELDVISKEQIKLSYQVSSFMDILAKMDIKIENLDKKVDKVMAQANENAINIEKITVRIDYLEGKV